jgi:predicted oxidoreductase
MKTIVLGQSSLKTSRMAYGCWRLIAPWEDCEITPEREARGRQALIAAFESGFTLFDHADIYCYSAAERLFGKVLKEIPGMRDQVVITTKCGIRKAGGPDPEAPYRYDASAEHILSSCDQSLERLGIERIDLFQLHRPDYLMRPEEVANAFSQLKDSGKVKEFGVSNFKPHQLAMLQKFCPMRLIVHQVEINLEKLDRFHDGTLDQCIEEKMTPLAWSPLAGGRLGSNDPIRLTEEDHVRRLRMRETLDLLGRLYDVPRAVVALAWLMAHPSGIVPIIGTTDQEKIRVLAKAPQLELTRDEWYHLLQSSMDERLP